MTKNRIVKYVANTALLAVLAAAGIGAYQIGTYTPEKKLQEEIPSDTEKDSEEISMVDVDASLVDSEISDTMQNKNTEEELVHRRKKKVWTLKWTVCRQIWKQRLQIQKRIPILLCRCRKRSKMFQRGQ